MDMRYSITVLALCIFIFTLQIYSSYAESCDVIVDRDTIEIKEDAANIAEINIWHNLKGTVELRDAENTETSRIQIGIEKQAGAEYDLDLIHITNHVTQRKYDSLLTLQIDYTPVVNANLVGAAGIIGGVVFLILIVILVCAYQRRHKEILRAPGDTMCYSSPKAHERSTLSSKEHQENTIESRAVVSSLLRHRNVSGSEASFPPPPPPISDPQRKYDTYQSTSGDGTIGDLRERSARSLPRDYRDYREPTAFPGSKPINRMLETRNQGYQSHSLDRENSPLQDNTSIQSEDRKLFTNERRAVRFTDTMQRNPHCQHPQRDLDNNSPNYNMCNNSMEKNRSTSHVSNNGNERDNFKEEGGGRGVRLKSPFQSAMLCITLLSLIAVAYANCGVQPTVNVIIYLPLNLNQHDVKVFYNRDNSNPRPMDQFWTYSNITDMSVYDLKSAKSHHGVLKPCDTHRICPEAAQPNIMSCDPLSSQCVCQRGYRYHKHMCIDIDECQNQVCPSNAVCQNTVGSYICHCGLGYYNSFGDCRACSSGCPYGQYEAVPCTFEADRICQACQECTGAFLEISPCLPYSNRQCLHAAHPEPTANHGTQAGYLEGLKVGSSKNVFLENLHNTKHLETSYYVTDNKQETDFNWFRASGIRVNIGLKDLRIIPEFTDVSHRSDNEFIKRNRNIPDARRDFIHVIDNFCRHPIPDYYLLLLDVYLDRMTTAQERTCDHNFSCPHGYRYGDTYIERAIDAPCTKLGTSPQPTAKNANVMACTESNDLLSKVFNRTASPVQTTTVPSRYCRTARNRCEDCMSRANCQSKDILESKCCDSDCLASEDCKVMYSQECTQGPVQCASGDAYEFMISPEFRDKRNQFQCHLRRKKPRILYKLWFYVSVINTSFETPRIHHTVHSDEIDDVNAGEFQMNFFSIRHDSGLELDGKDFILSGRKVSISPSEYETDYTWNFMLHHMKRPDEYSTGRMWVQTNSNTQQQVSVQFDEPFAYSSSNWRNNTSCNKNVTKFKSAQEHYKGPGEPVNPSIDTVDLSSYHYTTRSTLHPPKVSFLIPSNISVLDWWFAGTSAELIIDESLHCDLSLSDDGRVWTVYIEGAMTECPGYVNIVINDRVELEEIFRYDALITYPTTFNVSFKIPNWGLLSDKTFDIAFNDTKKVHHVYLTYMDTSRQNVWYQNKDINNGDRNEASHDKTKISTFAKVLIFLTVFVIMSGFLHVLLQLTKKTKAEAKEPQKYDMKFQPKAGIKRRGFCCGKHKVFGPGRFVFLVLYISTKIIYIFSFTFTILYTFVIFMCIDDIEKFSDLQGIQRQVSNASLKATVEIEDFAHAEIVRQLNLVNRSEHACNIYTDELITEIWTDISEIMESKYMDTMLQKETSRSHFLRKRFEHLMNRYEDKMTQYKSNTMDTHFERNVKPYMDMFQIYFEDLYQNDWLLFPQMLYNKSLRHNIIQEKLSDTKFDPNVVGLLQTIGILNIEDGELARINYWERYNRTLPTPPSWSNPNMERSCLKYMSLTGNDQVPTIKRNREPTFESTHITPLNQLNSSLFFTIDSLDKGNNIHVDKRDGFDSYSRHFHQEVLHTLSNMSGSSHNSIGYEMINELQFYKGIFLILDILLILYRLSHLYINVHHMCYGFVEQMDIKKSLVHTNKDTDNDDMLSLPSSAPESIPLKTNLDTSSIISTEGGFKRWDKLKQPNGDTHYGDNKRVLSSCIKGNVIKHCNFQSTLEARQSMDICQSYAKNILFSAFIPKCLITSVIFILLYVLFISFESSSSQFVYSFGAFSRIYSHVRVHVDTTNSYLQLQAEAASNSMGFLYAHMSTPILAQLVAIVSAFNTDQQAATRRFKEEVCAIMRSYYTNQTCSIDTEPIQLLTPGMPCNTIPITASVFKLNARDLEQDIYNMLNPLLKSSQEVIFTFLYIILFCIVTTVICYCIHSVILQLLRTQRLFPVKSVFVVPVKCTEIFFNATPSFDDMSRDKVALYTSGISLDDSNLDTHEIMSTQSEQYLSRKQVQFSPIKATLTVPRTDTVMSDLGYSETKV